MKTLTKMEKIFDKDVIEYLKEAGISSDEISKIQFNKLKEHALNLLKVVSDLIEKEEFDEIESYVGYSPSGDGHGLDNYFINFGSVLGDSVYLDIMGLCYQLKEYKIYDTEGR